MGGPLRVVFMGTPEFAVPSLKALVEAGYDVAAVVTQPEKPKGRGRKVSPSPVKEFASACGLKVLEPASIRDEAFVKGLSELAPDFIVVVAYGKILPPSVLKIPRYGCINVHASLLPKYRGAAPINWAVIRGEKETGVTTMLMDEGMDTGPVLLSERVSIAEDDTSESLSKRLADLGAALLVKTLRGLTEGSIKPKPQNNELASYAPLLKKEDGRIDFSKTASEVANLVRGTRPWPCAYTFWRGRLLKIHAGRALKEADEKNGCRPGTVVEVSDDSIKVKCAKGLFAVTELQLEGRRRMKAGEFLRGNTVEEGEVLG